LSTLDQVIVLNTRPVGLLPDAMLMLTGSQTGAGSETDGKYQVLQGVLYSHKLH
jgi:hypothetical protein